MNYLIKLLSVNCVFAFIYSKNITLLDYGLEPKTINCTHGYASINHTIVLTCLVNYSKDESINHVEFRRVNLTDGTSTHFLDYDIKKNCVPTGNSTDCVAVGKDAVKITVKEHASQEYSGANIYALLFGGDRTNSIQSNTIKLPEITEIGSECNITTDNGGTIENNDYTQLVYIIIPTILGVALPVCLIIFCWRRYRKRKLSSEGEELQKVSTNERHDNDVGEAAINSNAEILKRQKQITEQVTCGIGVNTPLLAADGVGAQEDIELQDVSTKERHDNDVGEAAINSNAELLTGQVKVHDGLEDVDCFFVSGVTRIPVNLADVHLVYQSYIDKGFEYVVSKRKKTA